MTGLKEIFELEFLRDRHKELTEENAKLKKEKEELEERYNFQLNRAVEGQELFNQNQKEISDLKKVKNSIEEIRIKSNSLQETFWETDDEMLDELLKRIGD